MTKQSNIDWSKHYKKTQKAFRKRFKKNIYVKDIKKAFRDYLDAKVDEMIDGEKAQLDNFNTLEIVGVPLVEHQCFNTFLTGKRAMFGKVVRMNFNYHRKDFIYDVRMVNSIRPELYFFPDKEVRKKVHHALITNNTYYRIERGTRK